MPFSFAERRGYMYTSTSRSLSSFIYGQFVSLWRLNVNRLSRPDCIVCSWEPLINTTDGYDYGISQCETLVIDIEKLQMQQKQSNLYLHTPKGGGGSE